VLCCQFGGVQLLGIQHLAHSLYAVQQQCHTSSSDSEAAEGANAHCFPVEYDSYAIEYAVL
jgi:hypothetical protein